MNRILVSLAFLLTSVVALAANEPFQTFLLGSPTATTLTGSEVMYCSQSATSKQCTPTQLMTFINANGSPNLATATGTLPTTSLPAFSGDIATSAGSSVTTIQPGAITSAKQAAIPFGSIVGAACTTGTCSPTPLSTTDFLFNSFNDQLTLGGAATSNQTGQFSNFAVITPATISSPGVRASGFVLKGGDNTSATSGGGGGGFIMQSGLDTAAGSGSSNGAITLRTGNTEPGIPSDIGNSSLIKIYTGDTSTPNSFSGDVRITTGSAQGLTGSMLFLTGENTNDAGTAPTGSMTFGIGSNDSGGTGKAGSFTFILPTDISPIVNSSHGSFIVARGQITGITTAQEYFTGNNLMSGGIVFTPSFSLCTPCNGDGQVVLSNASISGGAAVDFKGSLNLYSGLIDNNKKANYTTTLSGTNCTAIANKQGGPTAGSFTVTTGAANASCTVVITIGQAVFPALSATGWVCYASEATAGTNLAQFQAALSTTSCTLKGVIAASGDLVMWSARGFL